jgi:ATP-binding cassette, subfamily F, member 3
MIQFDNISKSFGGQVLFEQINFKLNSRERVGVVGRNGHGKTTLFRLITGEEAPDAGNIIVPKNYRVGYLRQHLEFTENTVLKEGMRGLPPAERDHHWKVEKVLAGLGFSTSDMARHPLEFSGGFQVRLNLVKVLVSDPDLLLLDEPTNYLDITSIRWIERFLVSWPHELMVITHDRSFIDKVVTHTLGIHRRKVRKLPGDTGKYYGQLAQDEEVYEKTRLNDERRRKDIELFISRFRAKARLANMVQSRVKTLNKMEKRDKLEQIKTLDFSFRSRRFPGKQVMNIQDLSFSYEPDKPLISGLSLSVGARERVCVVGKNGKGKTTLLKLLAGSLQPREGRIVYHPETTAGVFEQTNISTLVPNRTVEEEILYSHPDVERQHARNICGGMMFEGDDALKKISVLSGGEKSRVMLGKLLVTPVNLLILDEPTNHLDMESSDSLLAALDSFDGTIVMVTHNEMFLHALAERLIVFQSGGLMVFDGTYQEFLDQGGWEEEEGLRPERKDAAPEAKGGRQKKELRRLRSELTAERSRAVKPLENRISRAENEIGTEEKKLQELGREMAEASRAQDGNRIREISQAIHNAQTVIDRRFEELEKLTVLLDRERAVFDKRLEALDQ